MALKIPTHRFNTTSASCPDHATVIPILPSAPSTDETKTHHGRIGTRTQPNSLALVSPDDCSGQPKIPTPYRKTQPDPFFPLLL